MKTLHFILLATLLSLGHTQGEKYDIIVTDKIRVQRCVLKEGHPRSIAVGFPGGFNYAFDALRAAPQFTWQGGFLDFTGELTGRGGHGSRILGTKQPLGTAPVPFRIGSPDSEPTSIRFQGYTRDPATGIPAFLSETDGIQLSQTLTSPTKDTISLQLTFPGGSPETATYYLIDRNALQNITLSKNLKWSSDTAIEIPAATESATITLHLKPDAKVFVRKEQKRSGIALFNTFCSSCHSTDGSKLIGPSFHKFWGKEQTVTRAGNTETITIDENYVLESITHPQAAIVQGYEAVPMANFSSALTAPEIERLISHLKKME